MYIHMIIPNMENLTKLLPNQTLQLHHPLEAPDFIVDGIQLFL